MIYIRLLLEEYSRARSLREPHHTGKLSAKQTDEVKN